MGTGSIRFVLTRTAALCMCIACFLSVAGVTHAAVTLAVLNPQGEIAPPPVFVPTARVASLDGKKIGIYWNGKQGGENFWDVVEEQLKTRYPSAEVIRYKGPFDLGQAMAEKIAKECDVFMYGVGD
ncbi:MAG TPA: hypothetical protein VMT62_02500 [Syntrophorhabdaceae bacterium]|nr:hypothetical protein [Syntrophorhabdaceae bacterium]